LQGCEIFNEVEPMYPEAAIKSFVPPKHEATKSKSLTKLAQYSTTVFALNCEVKSKGALLDPSLIG
jgi:hypothetical protein